MTVVIVFEENGKTKFLANVKFAGSDEEEWNPRRLEVKMENFSDMKVKAHLLSRTGLEPLAIEEGMLVVFPVKPPKPALPSWVPKPFGRKVAPSHVAYVSTIGTACGIATYTKFLSDEVNKLYPVKLHRHVHEVEPTALIHLQAEFGIFPYVDELVGERVENNYKVCTFHTTMRNPQVLLDYYHTLDEHYDCHVVHNFLAKKYLKAYMKSSIYVIPHGSILFNPTPKDEARRKLGLPLNRKMVFCFGFASASKGFEEVAKTAKKMKDTLFVISGAVHGFVGQHSKKVLERLKSSSNNVIVLGRYLTEDEINLYASACDCLLFNYKTPGFISSASGALHRVIAAGKPLVTSIDNRLIELEDGRDALKFKRGDVEEMEYCLKLVLSDKELASKLGENARHLAEETSWQKIAKKHFELYEKLVGDAFGQEWYDEKYFAGKEGGKVYVSNGQFRKWSYYNPSGEWLGAEPVMKAIKKLLNPRNMLSAGCGRGTFCAYAKDVGIEAVGIDFSWWALSHPYKRAKGLIQLGDVRDIKFPDNSFDMVFATDIMEHIYEEDLDKVISEFQRVSRKWIFYNIATTEGEEFKLKKGKLPSAKWQATALAGHVNVRHLDYWRQKLRNKNWILRDDLVQKFRSLVPSEVLKNWITIFITQKDF